MKEGNTMDAGRLWLLSDFIGTNKVSFQIPVYQRNYDWSESNCNRLLQDVENMIDDDSKHFLGAIVYMADKRQSFSLKEFTIIDGQQRLTTTMLLLKALADAAAPVSPDCAEDIIDSYLYNQRCSEDLKIKLKPVKTDNQQFQALLHNKFDELNQEGHIWRNYRICKERIDYWMQHGITPQQILEALQKLEIVEIVLEKGVDDPQIIFESINSTGLELSNADLIRNFLLMNADEQEELYEDYWLKIEKDLKQSTDYANLNLFFTHYLIFKTRSSVDSNRLYEKFVKLYNDKGYTQREILSELRHYASIYTVFVYDNDTAYSPVVRKALRSLRQLKQTTCYPFLLHIFDDYSQGVIDLVTLEKVLVFLLSYLLRRMVCGVQSNTLRGLFTYLYGRIFKVSSNKQKYFEAINKFLHVVTTKDVVPSDREFERALNTANIYRNTALAKFLLMDIENGDSKETLSVSTLTIEHIMPQTISAQWKHIPSEMHEQYLGVLGNLSVTGYNSELSNKSFSEKKAIIQENSKAVILNSDVLAEDEWTIDAIKKRGKRLAKLVMNRYHIVRIDDPSIEFEYLSTIKLDDFSQVTGKTLVTFTLENEVYRQNKYSSMLIDVVKLLDSKYPSILDKVAEDIYCSGNRNHPMIANTDEGMYNGYCIREGIYVEIHLNSIRIMQLLKGIIEECYHLPYDAFSISVIADADNNEDEEEE